jgi:hypothetical protein
MAAANLGALLQEQGDLAGARAAYQHAIAYGQAESASFARRRLGELR